MTSNLMTKMLRSFEASRPTQMFLSSFFKTSPGSYYSSDTVQLDIERTEEEMAVPVQDVAAGYREVAWDQYVNKEYVAPVYQEAFKLNNRDMRKRQAGQNPFMDPTMRANAIKTAFRNYGRLLGRVERALEDMAAQILTTGTLTLTDGTNTIYTIDFKPKSTHFPTAVVPWTTVATADPVTDLAGLADVIRDDGLVDPTTTIWDVDSFEAALRVTSFESRFDGRRADLGAIVPLRQDVRGEQYRGTVDMGNYKLDIWTYNGRRKGPSLDGSGTKGPYVPTKKVIMLDPTIRLDATYGTTGDRIVPISPALSSLVPSMLTSSKSGIRLTTNAWVDDKGETFWGGAGTRPLLIPVQIDGFGCLDTDLA